MTAPNPSTDGLTDVLGRLERWADYCLARAIESSIEAFYRQPDLEGGSVEHARALEAERRATFHYGYVQALHDTIDRLKRGD